MRLACRAAAWAAKLSALAAAEEVGLGLAAGAAEGLGTAGGAASMMLMGMMHRHMAAAGKKKRTMETPRPYLKSHCSFGRLSSDLFSISPGTTEAHEAQMNLA